MHRVSGNHGFGLGALRLYGFLGMAQGLGFRIASKGWE